MFQLGIVPFMYTLYGSEVSLYTGKLRAYLRYKQLPFNEVLSTVGVYKKTILPKTGVAFIPVVKTPDGEYLQDTARIIDHLEMLHSERSVVPIGAKQRLVSELFALWGDEWLVIPAMHYRWNKDNFPFIYQEFGRVVSPNSPAFIRAYFGKKLAKKFSGFVPVLGITEHSIPTIEKWYENTVLHHLNKHFADHDYLLGGRPCIGDFGLMGPLYAHLYRDPAPGNLMKRIAPNVAAWVERMNQACVTSADYVEHDEIPDTLLPLLKDMFEQQWPVLNSTATALSAWRRSHPKERFIPRSVGEHSFAMGGISEKRFISSFHQYKQQRVLDTYQQINDENNAQLAAFLVEIGGLEHMQMTVEDPVTVEDNKLIFA